MQTRTRKSKKQALHLAASKSIAALFDYDAKPFDEIRLILIAKLLVTLKCGTDKSKDALADTCVFQMLDTTLYDINAANEKIDFTEERLSVLADKCENHLNTLLQQI